MAILKDLIVNGASRFIGDAYFNTIKAGVWNGTAIDVSHGGTGLTSLSSGYLLEGKTSSIMQARAITTSITSGSTGIPTSGAVYEAISAGFAANGAMVFKGTYTAQASSSLAVVTSGFSTSPGLASLGWTWIVTGNNTYFGNIVVEAGDMIISKVSNPGTTISNYYVIQTNIDVTHYVTTNTAQTITGAKTFNAETTFNKQATFNKGLISTSVGDSDTDVLFVSGNSSFNDIVNIYGQTNHGNHVIPMNNNSYDLGNSSLKWRNIYAGSVTATTFTGSLSGNASTATTATNLSSKPSFATYTSDTTKITLTAGGKTSDAYTVPYATYSNTVKGAYTSNGGQQNPNYFGNNRVGFLMMNTTVNGNSNYKDWIIMDCYNGNDVGGGVAFGVNRQNLGAYIMRSESARNSWAESAELYGTHNLTKSVVTGLIGQSTYANKYTYSLPSNKGVRITYTPYDPVIISVSGSNSGAQLILIGVGYGEGGTIRNKFTELVSSSLFDWSLPQSDSISCSVEVYSRRDNDSNVVVIATNTVTFTAINALTTDKQNATLLTSSNYTSYALPLSGGTMNNKNVVTNLNADLLDGQHGSYYAAASSLGNYLSLSGGTLTGNLTIKKSSSDIGTYVTKTDSNGTTIRQLLFGIGSSGLAGIYDYATSSWIVSISKDSPYAATFNGNASTATALTTNAGNSKTPVYFSGGKPVSTGYDLSTFLTSASAADTYLPLSGGTMTGALGKSDNYLIKPVADYRTKDNSHTGCIAVTLPATIGNTMVSMWIDVYNYLKNTSFSVHCGGYTYSNSTWENHPFAMVYGASHRVRLGHNGTNFVVYIGETDSSWSYPQVTVRDVMLGYSQTYANWYKDWTISFVTSVSNVTADITRYAITSSNISSQSVNYAASAGSVAWGNVSGKPSTFTPSSHTHTFASITNKITSGNEFNFVDAEVGEIWLNYRRASGSAATKATQYFNFGQGTSSQTYAYLKANGFIKSNSSDSYVLLGGGGHKSLSDMPVSTHARQLIDLYDNESSADDLKVSNALVNKGTPNSAWYHVTTDFYQSTSGPRFQFAGTYNSAEPELYIRHIGNATGATWTAWKKLLREDVANSTYISNVAISGNYLRVTKNGSNSDLTIPYATNSDTVDGYHVTSLKTVIRNSKDIDISSGAGWYRILDCTRYSMTFFITFYGSYSHRPPTPVTYLVSHSYRDTAISQIGKCAYEGWIQAIRAVHHDTYQFYIDVKFGITGSGASNEVAFEVTPMDNRYTSFSLIDYTKQSDGDGDAICNTSTSFNVDYADSAGSVAWSNITSKPAATGGATTPVYWNGSGFTNCTSYANASVNYATSAGILDITQITSEADITNSGLRLYRGSGAGWTGTIPSMQYAAILHIGNYSRGFEIWTGRDGDDGGAINSLKWRRGKSDQTDWSDIRFIADSVNSSLSTSSNVVSLKLLNQTASIYNTTYIDNLTLYANKSTTTSSITLVPTEWKQLCQLSATTLLSNNYGTYVVQITKGTGSSFVFIGSGIMSYGSTNSSALEEIVLHCYGGDDNRLYLGTQNGYLMGAAKVSQSAAQYTITFKRII